MLRTHALVVLLLSPTFIMSAFSPYNRRFPHLSLVPLLSFLPGAGGHVGVLILDTLHDLVHVQRPLAVVPYDHCLVLHLGLQLFHLLQGADMDTTGLAEKKKTHYSLL